MAEDWRRASSDDVCVWSTKREEGDKERREAEPVSRDAQSKAVKTSGEDGMEWKGWSEPARRKLRNESRVCDCLCSSLAFRATSPSTHRLTTSSFDHRLPLFGDVDLVEHIIEVLRLAGPAVVRDHRPALEQRATRTSRRLESHSRGSSSPRDLSSPKLCLARTLSKGPALERRTQFDA